MPFLYTAQKKEPIKFKKKTLAVGPILSYKKNIHIRERTFYSGL